jgi:replication factor A1
MPLFSSQELLEQLKKKTGKSEEELDAIAEEKTQKFNGLLSKEAALFLLARENGIVVEGKPLQPIPINQLLVGSGNVDVIGIAKRIFPVKEFQNKNKPGTGKRASVLIADATGEIFATFWHHDAEKTNTIPTGATVLLRNVSVSNYNNQTGLNFGYKSEIEINPKQANELTLPTIEIQKAKIGEIQEPAFNLNVEGKVDEVFAVHEFTKSNGEGGRLQRIRITDENNEIQAIAWNEKTSETENLKSGWKIRLENTRSKNNLRGETELSIDSGTRIVILEKTVMEHSP